jgi:hypothetical protein
VLFVQMCRCTAIRTAHFFKVLFVPVNKVCVWKVINYVSCYYKFPDLFTNFPVSAVVSLKEIKIVIKLVVYEVSCEKD